jgi:hypothetical protein
MISLEVATDHHVVISLDIEVEAWIQSSYLNTHEIEQVKL